MNNNNLPHDQEWNQSAIHPSLINLNLKSLDETEIGDWFFQHLPRSARRNDGRIRDGYLRAYTEPLKGGWGIEGYDPTDWSITPQLRSFKPDHPRIGKDGKLIKYDFPKNARHNPLLPRVSYEIAALIFRNSGLNFLEITKTYASEKLVEGIEDAAECQWFWQAVLDHHSIPLSIAEGGKKALSLLSQGRCALALSSITTWRKERGSNQVHPWLALFAHKRKFYLTFDQDAKRQTIRAVNTQAFKLSAALIKSGAARVKRLVWSGTTKGIDDFIFSLISKHGQRACQKILSKCYQNAQDYRRFGAVQPLPGRIRQVNKQYLDIADISSSENKHKILVIKSAKSTGKTHLLTELIKQDRELNIPNINLSHLERLARELGERLDLPYRTEAGTVSLRNALGYSLCIDSFTPHNSIPFHPEQWQDAGISIDEFTQVLRHLSFGTTELKKYRKLVLATLGQKLADCWANNKPIRLLDADADAETVELVYELIQLYSEEPITREELTSQTLTLINTYQPQKGNLSLYDEPSPKQILADLTKRLKKRENLLILSSSQKARSADGTINLEKLALRYYKPSEILRIDSSTTGDPEHRAFNLTGEYLTSLLLRKNEVKENELKSEQQKQEPEQLNIFDSPKESTTSGVKKKQLDDIKVVIASPTICTGISIDGVDDYFAGVFSFQSGNITPNSVRQQLVRLRDFQVPRYVWCPKLGKNFIGSRSTNPIELLTDQKGEAKLSLGLLGYREAAKLIESNLCPLTKYWAKVGANQNQVNYHYREILLADLEAEGWQIKIVNRSSQEEKNLDLVWEERKQIKQDSIRKEQEKITQAADLPADKASVLERRRDLTSSQQRQLYKFQLKQKYGVNNLSSKLIAADGKQFYSTLRLRFWLTAGRDYLNQNDSEKVEQYQLLNQNSLFIPDLNSKLSITKIKLLELLDLERFLDPAQEWHNKSPELLELRDFVVQDLVRFNQILKVGIAITDSPITVLQKILRAVALKLTYLRNERDGKKRLRVYGSAVSRFDLDEIEAQAFSDWLLAEEKKRAALSSGAA